MTEAEWLAATDARAMLEFLCGDRIDAVRPWYASRGPRTASERKLRLLASAYARVAASQILDWDRPDAASFTFGTGGVDFLEVSRRATETAEGYADGLCPAQNLHDAHLEAMHVGTALMRRVVELMREGRRTDRVLSYRRVAELGQVTTASDAGRAAAEAYQRTLSDDMSGPTLQGRGLPGWWDDHPNWQAFLVREIFGNPFRPAIADATWTSPKGEAVVTLAANIYARGNFRRAPELADALEDAGCTDPELLGHLREPGPHVRGCWALDLVLGKS
jgi:hypothetical protein